MGAKEEIKLDAAIVGGGILGLMLAWELANKYPHWEIAIFEKEKFLAEHTTGRNSGVLHAGLYYPQNSLKHLLCLEGNELWIKLAQDYQLPVRQTGKYIVASRPQEESLLESLFLKAQNNGVQARWSSAQELAQLSSSLHIQSAFFTPTSGIINVSQLISFLNDELFKKQVPVLKETEVSKVRKQQGRIHFQAGEDQINSSLFFNCAGLWATELRQQLGLHDLAPFWVKGNYLKYNGTLPFKNLIYPIPPQDGQGLGVHLTFDWDGINRFGPNTESVSEINYHVNHSWVEEMSPSIHQLFKGIDSTKLSVDYAGIRPKIKANGTLYTDFWIKSGKDLGIEGYYECCGIESPGLTAAPAIVKKILNTL